MTYGICLSLIGALLIGIGQFYGAPRDVLDWSVCAQLLGLLMLLAGIGNFTKRKKEKHE